METLSEALTTKTFDYLFFVIQTLFLFGLLFFLYSYVASVSISKNKKYTRRERRIKSIELNKQTNNIKLKK